MNTNGYFLSHLFQFFLHTYSTVQSPSWEANWFAASQEIPRISRNPNVHYRTHNRPAPVSILGQHYPVHIPTSHSWRSSLILSTLYALVSPVVSFPPVSPPRPYTPPSPHPYAPHAHPISFFSMARMGEERTVYRFLVGKPEGKRPLGWPLGRWVDNIRMDLQAVGCGYMDWTRLAQDRDRWRTYVSAVMNIRVPWNAGNFLTSCKPVNFSRRTLHHGVSKKV